MGVDTYRKKQRSLFSRRVSALFLYKRLVCYTGMPESSSMVRGNASLLYPAEEPNEAMTMLADRGRKSAGTVRAGPCASAGNSS